MKKVALLATAGVIALVGPALAKPQKPVNPATKSPHGCAALNKGYNARGTLVQASLTSESDGTFSGSLEVDVTKANHHAQTGDQTFTLSHARVKFHHGVDPTAPAPGSRVKLHGKITQLPKPCSTNGFTPTITIKKVDIHQAKH